MHERRRFFRQLAKGAGSALLASPLAKALLPSVYGSMVPSAQEGYDSEPWRVALAREWKLPPSLILEGYLNQASFAPWETVRVMVSADPRIRYKIALVRHGGPKPETIFESSEFTGWFQKTNVLPYENGAGWQQVYEFKIMENARVGLHSVELRPVSPPGTTETSSIPFVVKGSAPKSRLLVLSSTLTWQAYNPWGGHCTYVHLVDKPISYVMSFDRPMITDRPEQGWGHLAGGEVLILKWLESQGIEYDLLSELDYHKDPALLRNYKAVLLNTHPEYWTSEMVDGLSAYVNSGGSLINLSANGLFCKAVLKGNQVEIMRHKGGYGGTHRLSGERGGQWRELGKPESSVLGAGIFLPNWGTFGPYQVNNERHWIFKGTGLRNGNTFGSRSTNDGADPTWKGRAAASGWEVDVTDQNSPQGTKILAKGTNGNGAELIYCKKPGGGRIFGVGSITFGGSLAIDPIVSRITRNVIDQFTV